MERSDIDIDYDKELDNRHEKTILRSSTTKVLGFVKSLFDQVFVLLEKLERPNSFRLYSDDLENKVLNMLARVFTIFLATLLPDLFNIALGKTARFATSTGFQQITSTVGFLCNAFIKVNPGKSLKRLLPLFINSIYREIDTYRASITADTEILLGDYTLV